MSQTYIWWPSQSWASQLTLSGRRTGNENRYLQPSHDGALCGGLSLLWFKILYAWFIITFWALHWRKGEVSPRNLRPHAVGYHALSRSGIQHLKISTTSEFVWWQRSHICVNTSTPHWPDSNYPTFGWARVSYIYPSMTFSYLPDAKANSIPTGAESNHSHLQSDKDLVS